MSGGQLKSRHRARDRPAYDRDALEFVSEPRISEAWTPRVIEFRRHSLTKPLAEQPIFISRHHNTEEQALAQREHSFRRRIVDVHRNLAEDPSRNRVLMTQAAKMAVVELGDRARGPVRTAFVLAVDSRPSPADRYRHRHLPRAAHSRLERNREILGHLLSGSKPWAWAARGSHRGASYGHAPRETKTRPTRKGRPRYGIRNHREADASHARMPALHALTGTACRSAAAG